MARTTEALEQLAQETRGRTASETVTWGELADILDEVAKSISRWEYEDRMGEDL